MVKKYYISMYFKFIKKKNIILKKKYYYFFFIFFTFNNIKKYKNSLIFFFFFKNNLYFYLHKYYYLTRKSVKGGLHFFFKFFFKMICKYLFHKINLYFFKLNKSIINIYNYFKKIILKMNRSLVKINYYSINNIFITEKIIFGFMKKKKYPRKKKFLKKKIITKFNMFLKYYKPKNNSLRNKILLRFNKYTKFKRLTLNLKKKNGKNLCGSINSKYRGGGVRFKYRVVDNYCFKYNLPFRLLGYDYCYHRNVLLGLLSTTNEIKKYIILPESTVDKNIFNVTFNFKNKVENLGDTLPIGWIPTNTLIYNLELYPGSGFKLIRSAGTYGKIIEHTNTKVKILLPSKKYFFFSKYCLAMVGRTSNMFFKFQKLGKAGYRRNLNRRPRVCGENMNACDHPNGGRTRGGKPTKNYWGIIIK